MHKAILSLLVVAAVIALADSGVLSGKKLSFLLGLRKGQKLPGHVNIMRRFYPKGTATVINGDREPRIRIQKEAEQESFNQLNFEVKSMLNGEDDNELCGKELGLQLKDKPVICGLMTVFLDSFNQCPGGKHNILFNLLFHDMKNENVFGALTVPFIEMPIKYETDEEARKNWAKRRKVTLLPPKVLQNLANLDKNKETEIELGWLNPLLAKYGVRETTGSMVVSYPTALPSELYRNIVDFFVRFKGNKNKDLDKEEEIMGTEGASVCEDIFYSIENVDE